MLTADVTVLIVTWVRTFRHARTLVRLGIKTSVSLVLLQDGTCQIERAPFLTYRKVLLGSIYFLYDPPINVQTSLHSLRSATAFLIIIQVALVSSPAPLRGHLG